MSQKLPPLPGHVPHWFREPTLWQRFAGSLIDGVLTGLSSLVVYLVAVVGFGADSDSWDSAAITLTVAALVFGYEVGLVVTTGQTIGKIAMRTRVVAFDDGGHVEPGAAVRRWFVAGGVTTLLGLFVGPIAGLGFVYTLVVFWPILQPPLHRGLHDRAAGTIVTNLAGQNS